MEQLSDFLPFVDSLFVVTTPGALLAYEAANSQEVAPNVLEQKLKKVSTNLLVFDARAKAFSARRFDRDESLEFFDDEIYSNNPYRDNEIVRKLLRGLDDRSREP